VIIVAHRLSTVTGADNIVIIEDGRVIEMGNHEALISHQGRYYQLYSRQSGTYAAPGSD
jgi:ABC-type multidrug transport system fused ATPase/permease subunit